MLCDGKGRNQQAGSMPLGYMRPIIVIVIIIMSVEKFTVRYAKSK